MHMEKIMSLLKLKKEAVLLDSLPFIIKTFLAILTAYYIGSQNPVASKDMISVLFGLILTLEPVNVTGMRRGWEQFFATMIGAVTTAVIITVFGVHGVTIAASVALTLYVCLKVNWREISPVALFTAIYMTQAMQLDAAGAPSVLLTMRLRIIALGFGVFTAVVFNFIFSMIQYRSLGNKRIVFLMKSLLNNMDRLEKSLRNGELDQISIYQYDLVSVFNDIDSVKGLFEDMLGDNAKIRKRIGVSDERMRAKISAATRLRVFCHLLFDTQFILVEDGHMLDQAEVRLAIADQLSLLMDQLGSLKDYTEKRTGKISVVEVAMPTESQSGNLNRIQSNLFEMHLVLNRIVGTMENMIAK